MRKLIASTFVSLDGVMQAPGGPDEDPRGGFAYGGWVFPYWGEDMDASAAGFDAHGRELVLGRRTYEIFAAHWPYQPADDPTAISLNSTRKHVASRTLETLEWNNSTLLEGDAATAIAALKRTPGPDLQVIGSGALLQALQAAALVDEFNVWTFPLVLGRGRRLFEDGTRAAAFELVESRTSTTGVVMSRYVLDGEPATGSFAATEPSERELERRRKWAAEGR